MQHISSTKHVAIHNIAHGNAVDKHSVYITNTEKQSDEWRVGVVKRKIVKVAKNILPIARYSIGITHQIGSKIINTTNAIENIEAVVETASILRLRLRSLIAISRSY